MSVADSDVLIDFLTGAGPAAARVRGEIEAGTLATTAISRFELLAGARNERQRRSVEQLLAALPVLVLDAEAADRAALIRRELLDRGADIGMADSLIAGIVLSHGMTLLTRNRRHYERVDGLALVDLG